MYGQFVRQRRRPKDAKTTWIEFLVFYVWPMRSNLILKRRNLSVEIVNNSAAGLDQARKFGSQRVKLFEVRSTEVIAI